MDLLVSNNVWADFVAFLLDEEERWETEGELFTFWLAIFLKAVGNR